jgi:hypothetical protein
VVVFLRPWGSNGSGIRPWPDATLPSDVTTTVHPIDSNEVLLNPGKGWVIYTDVSTKSPEVWDVASVCYLRTMWYEVEPAENSFDWSVIDGQKAICTSHGKRFAFRIMPACSGCLGQATPQWVFEAGAKYTTGPDGKKYPVWNDPVYEAKMRAFIDALAARYDNGPDIAYIDAGNYGNWGEWHAEDIGGIDLSDADRATLIDMWSVFKHTPIIVPNNNDSATSPEYQAKYGTDRYGFGIRDDSSQDRPSGSAYAYDKAPAVSEWAGSYATLRACGGLTGQCWTDEWIPKYMNDSHYSYDNLGQWDTDSNLFFEEHRALVDEWANRMGYWFKVTTATFSRNLGDGTSGTINFSVRNDGVAPIYLNKNVTYVKLALLDGASNVLETTSPLPGINPFTWKPGEVTEETSSFSFDPNPAARKLAIGVFSDPSLADPDIKFGNEGRLASGWLVLGP